MPSVRFLIERSSERLEEGLRQFGRGELQRARREYLEAAEQLARAASQSPEPLRAQRSAQAEQLLQMAGDLEGRVDRTRSARAQTPSVPVTPRPSDESGAEDNSQRFAVQERPSVRFDDVSGLDDVKQQVQLKLIYPVRNPDAARRYGMPTGGGILLYGPPGTGKTLIARAIAGEIDAAFFTVRPSDVMSKWVGEAEKNVRELFDTARAADRSIIFIDEIEALVPARSTNSSVMQRVVPQFLAELEGFEGRPGSLLFIGATNEPWSIDPAMLRPGRFDELVFVPLPDVATRHRILAHRLRGRPVATDVDLSELATQTDGLSGADLVNICTRAAARPFAEAVRTGTARTIDRADFEHAVAGVGRSVTSAMLQRFDRFRASRSATG